MKRLLIVFLFLFCISCSGSQLPHDLELDHDVIVQLNGYSGSNQAEMNAALNEVIADFSSKFEFKEQYVTDAFVVFQPGLGKCSDVGAPCPGYLHGYSNVNGSVVYYKDDPSIRLNATAMRHELGHILLLRSHTIPSEKQDAFLATNFGY
jgi:hypothetical protein